MYAFYLLLYCLLYQKGSMYDIFILKLKCISNCFSKIQWHRKNVSMKNKYFSIRILY